MGCLSGWGACAQPRAHLALRNHTFRSKLGCLAFPLPSCISTRGVPAATHPHPQLAALPGLERLLLSAPRTPMAEEFRPLSVLTSLTCLHMLGYAFVPESISHLTWLSELR